MAKSIIIIGAGMGGLAAPLNPASISFGMRLEQCPESWLIRMNV